MTEIGQVGQEKRGIRTDPIIKKKMFGGCPREYLEILETIDKGKFFDEPNYERMYYLLRESMKNTGSTEYPYDWEESLNKKMKEEQEKKKNGVTEQTQKVIKKKEVELEAGKSLKEVKEKEKEKAKEPEKKVEKYEDEKKEELY
ncbi:Protein CBG13775 [Caenorhabditis briggsae]|nr:Protein CBG13775 [Caenorhabditis briggsae]ULT93310.1 hypothetical protein L3Y34_003057 [Caenorhabditis briggsae]CAP32514.2 Protein CBG13775 [Caenorhabditis briggsae]